MDKPLALIIEDDRDIAALLRHVLDIAGYQTEIAFHGQVAMERLSSSQPDLVILDLILPGVSGSEILKSLRKDERLSHTKVIVVTAHAHIAESLTVEPDLVLFKPISVDQFSDLIERFHLKTKYQTTIPMKNEPWDRVTGLYNQLFFVNRLDAALRRSQEIDQYLFAVIAISLDQDNNIKNQLNIKHWISILRETANILKTALGPTDTIARFDQDNFYILLENIPDKQTLLQTATRLHQILSEHLAMLGNKVQFPVRIGILMCDSKYRDVEQILLDAHAAQSFETKLGEIPYRYFDRVSIQGQPSRRVP